MNTTLTCPGCGATIPIEEAFTHEIEDQLRKEFEKKLKEQQESVAATQKEMEKKLSEQFEEEKKSALKDIKEKALKEVASQVKMLEEENKDKEKKLEEARKAELDVRRLMRKLEDDTKAFELEKQRQLDEERKRIIEEAHKQAGEESQIKVLELQKQLQDAVKANEDMRRKLQQGSQQTQGEVIELELEQTLKAAFPQDDILEVRKGVNGADVQHIVKSPRGTICGTILWESKHQKVWSDKWIPKLKEDLRQAKADVPALLTVTPPKGHTHGIIHVDGVWVCSRELIIPLAMLLRKSLIEVAYQKAVQQHRGNKADLLYEYITGHEFRQQIEALVEVFTEMQTQILKERASFEKHWKQREGQLQRLYLSTANMYGSIQGRVGSSAVPQVKGLDILELPDGD